MKKSVLLLLIQILLVQPSIAQTNDELAGTWLLQIENLQHEVITTANIHFTNLKEIGCLESGWNRVIVDSDKSSQRLFFPIDERLSYKLEDGKLSIGRNKICDDYLHLSGVLQNGAVVGEYFQFGWGRKQLGYFSLKHSGN